MFIDGLIVLHFLDLVIDSRSITRLIDRHLPHLFLLCESVAEEASLFFMALQEASEACLVGLFEDTGLCTVHAQRYTVGWRDSR